MFLKKRGKARKPRKFGKSPRHVSQNRFLQRTGVYLFHNFPFFWVNKFGITDHLRTRVNDVSESTRGYVFNFFSARLEFGWHLEQFIHGLYSFQRVPFDSGSGKNEWFLVLSPVVGSIVYYLDTRLGLHLEIWVKAGAFFCPFVWLDALFWLAVFAVLRGVLFVTLGFVLIYLIVHLPNG